MADPETGAALENGRRSGAPGADAAGAGGGGAEQGERAQSEPAAGREPEPCRRIPSATYRLQMNRAFRFEDAVRIIPYLQDLGITDCYLSPILKAGSDTDHGYDIFDYSVLNPVLGSQEDFDNLSARLRERGMGVLLDTVPNHMGIRGPGNRWWMDVLENGPSSTYASYFDIDWQPVRPELRNKVLLPILEDQYGTVLESGKLRLGYEEGAFYVHYHDNVFPVAPATYSLILRRLVDPLTRLLGQEDTDLQELRSVITAVGYLPARDNLSPEKAAERNREKEVIKRRLSALTSSRGEIREAIEQIVAYYNGRPGRSRSFDALDDLLTRQPYRPAFWKVAAEEINYRRFFDVNDLAAIRVERPEVFQASHDLVLRLAREGKVTGLRIDHPDGLWTPRAYFEQLQKALGPPAPVEPQPAGAVNGGRVETATPEDPFAGRRFYLVAEKILAEEEELPRDWAVDGTTGYDFLNAVNGLLVDPDQAQAFNRIYSEFVGEAKRYSDLVNSSKKLIMLVSMSAEINSLGHQLATLAGRNRRYRDFTLNSLIFALREIIAALEVYRTYIEPGTEPSPGDVAMVEKAVNRAMRMNVRTPREIFRFIRDTVLFRNLQEFRKEDRQEVIWFVMRFQQTTGPVMAKGVEDTAFYIYNRLVSINEVGGNPGRFGLDPAEFHRRNLERRERRPHSLLATSTHDAKRGEDVRARISALSEMPGEWRSALARWRRLNRSLKREVDGEPAPDANDEYLYYQTLVGAWPAQEMDAQGMEAFRDRIVRYMNKAVKEAKVRTSWVSPNEAYDEAVRAFVVETLEEKPRNRFLSNIKAFQARVAHFGRLNSLAQTLLKLTSPGVPDLYQGSELWDLRLVDPDNREPVDFETRSARLAEIRSAEEAAGGDLHPFLDEWLRTAADGRCKLYLIRRALRFRRDHAPLFREGDYLPLEVAGTKKKHVCAFARSHGTERIVVAVPRLVVGLVTGIERLPLGRSIWGDTELILPEEDAPARWRNVLTGEPCGGGEGGGRLPLRDVCASYPVALLERL